MTAENTRILVLGGTGVAGGSAISAVRRHYGDSADVTALWFGPREEELSIDGADKVIFGDITADETYLKIADAAGRNFTYAFFATARGNVGFPITNSTPEQIADACRFSFDPLLSLEKLFSVDVIVGYSTFYTLEHQKVNYGAMGYAKEKIERWVGESGRSRHVCIRSGAFRSDSSRAIRLMLQKNAKELASSGVPLLEKYFRGRKPSEAVALLVESIYREEKERYGDSGTTADDLLEAHLALLRHGDARFVNVCGRRIWLSEDPQLL